MYFIILFPEKAGCGAISNTAALYELLAGLGIPGIFDRVTMCAQQSRVCTQRATDRAEDSKRRPQLLTTVAGSADVDAWWKIGRDRTNQSFNLTKNRTLPYVLQATCKKTFDPFVVSNHNRKKKSKQHIFIFSSKQTRLRTFSCRLSFETIWAAVGNVPVMFILSAENMTSAGTALFRTIMRVSNSREVIAGSEVGGRWQEQQRQRQQRKVGGMVSRKLHHLEWNGSRVPILYHVLLFLLP